MTNSVNYNTINDIKIKFNYLLYLSNDKIILYKSNYLFV